MIKNIIAVIVTPAMALLISILFFSMGWKIKEMYSQMWQRKAEEKELTFFEKQIIKQGK